MLQRSFAIYEVTFDEMKGPLSAEGGHAEIELRVRISVKGLAA